MAVVLGRPGSQTYMLWLAVTRQEENDIVDIDAERRLRDHEIEIKLLRVDNRFGLIEVGKEIG